MLVAWVSDNNTQDWSVGLCFVQNMNNSVHYSGIKLTPYKAMLGSDPKVVLTSSRLPSVVLERLQTEGDLLALFSAHTLQPTPTPTHTSQPPMPVLAAPTHTSQLTQHLQILLMSLTYTSTCSHPSAYASTWCFSWHPSSYASTCSHPSAYATTCSQRSADTAPVDPAHVPHLHQHLLTPHSLHQYLLLQLRPFILCQYVLTPLSLHKHLLTLLRLHQHLPLLLTYFNLHQDMQLLETWWCQTDIRIFCPKRFISLVLIRDWRFNSWLKVLILYLRMFMCWSATFHQWDDDHGHCTGVRGSACRRHFWCFGDSSLFWWTPVCLLSSRRSPLLLFIPSPIFSTSFLCSRDKGRSFLSHLYDDLLPDPHFA